MHADIIWDDLEHVARNILGGDESAPVPLYITVRPCGRLEDDND